MNLSKIPCALFNALKSFYTKYLGKFINPIYAKYLQKHVDYIYLNHLKYNKYFEETVFLLKSAPGYIGGIYTKVASAFKSKTSPKQRKWLALAIIVWICVKVGFAGFDYWNEVSQPKTELGPNDSLIITPEQVQQVTPGPVIERDFSQDSSAVGIVDFNQDQTVPVFGPYQGRIGKVLVQAGEDVKVGQALYTVLSPDLAQAASTLVSSAGVLKMSNETLKRAKSLYDTKAISLKELEQNISDQQTADANYQAALKTIVLFGLTDAQIKQILAGRKIDNETIVVSPVAGKVVARNAAPGQLVQPGTAPAPVTVSDTTRLWMVASVPEGEIARYRVGQTLYVRVQAYPDKTYSGKVFFVGESSDPVTHRIQLRANLTDDNHELRPQMIADFNVVLGDPILSPAVPAKALVREADGTFVVWATNSDKSTQYFKRVVKVGLMQADYVQILDGIKPGDIVAQSNALFLSNLFINLH
jgi:cobalt-zinc-cadmium efflux system membrane fusion protein